MYNQTLFLQTLSRFAGTLPARYDLDVVLTDLMESSIAMLGLCGSGVTMAKDGRLRFVTTVADVAREFERSHTQQHPCPYQDSYATGEVVRVTDVRLHSTRWPEFSANGARLGVAGLAVIPMRLAERTIGTLNLYATEPREWSDEDIAVALVLADIATGYVVNAFKTRQKEQLMAQLQNALDSRCIIERATGITAQENGVTDSQAYTRMRRHASKSNASLGKVARAIVAVGLRV